MSPASQPESDRVPRAVWSATGVQVLGRLWTALAGFACLAILTRPDLPWAPLPSAQFGHLTFYLVLYALLECWADWGTAPATLQLGASDPSILGAAIRAGRRLRAGAALLGWALVSLLALVAGEPGIGWISLAALAPLSRCLELSSVVYHNELRWGVPVLLRSLVALARLLAFALLARSGVEHFGPYLASFALLGALGNLGLHALLRARLEALPQVQPGLDWRALLVGALPLALVSLAQQAYFYADNLILRALVEADELGRYNAAVKLLTLLIMVSGFATGSALPWLARRRGEQRLAQATARLMRSLYPTACLALGLLWPLSHDLMAALFGPSFAVAGESLRWLLLAAAVIYAGGPLLTGLVAASRSRALLYVVLSGLAFNLLGNLLLVPRLGSPGAALATLGTELWIAGAALLALRRAGLQPALGWVGLGVGPVCFGLAALLSWTLFH